MLAANTDGERASFICLTTKILYSLKNFSIKSFPIFTVLLAVMVFVAVNPTFLMLASKLQSLGFKLRLLPDKIFTNWLSIISKMHGISSSKDGRVVCFDVDILDVGFSEVYFLIHPSYCDFIRLISPTVVALQTFRPDGSVSKDHLNKRSPDIVFHTRHDNRENNEYELI